MKLRRLWTFTLIVIAAGILQACNTPPLRARSTPTPFIIFVTATLEGAPPASAAEGGAAALPPAVGPFDHTVAPEIDAELPAPTLDLSLLTAQPTPLPPGIPTPTASPTFEPTLEVTEEPVVTQAAARGPDGSVAPLFGINFISSAQHPADDRRIQVGLNAGAQTDRFAIYWNEIEARANRYEWGVYDQAVEADVEHGLQTNAILLGTPAVYADSRNVPDSLFEPVFADGTDHPGSGKRINPNNPWAEFVYAAVNRYRPGGVRAQQKGWASDQGVRIWEIWNEPDFKLFWGGTVEEYARMLKVAYIAAKQADPNARIMVGGLVFFEQPYFLNQLLTLYQNDPDPVAGTYPFNMVGVHSYSHPPYTFWIVTRAQNALAIHGLGDTPIWLNESGVAIWNDYPGPAWATSPDQIVWRATMSEQADYIVQNTAYAFVAGAEAMYHFQLYDDCGNQPAGTTFAPHDGGLCASDPVCWGDALGLVRNETDNKCFNQHPDAGTARPAFKTYQVMQNLFSSEPFVPLTFYSTSNGIHRRLIFARPNSSELLTFLWSETDVESEVLVPARSSEAVLMKGNGDQQTITPGDDGNYHVILAPATNRNQSSVSYMISGPPAILIEKIERPVVSILPLLDDSAAAFLVKWRSSSRDIQHYELWYRDDDGDREWILWFETDRVDDALFVGGSGRRYSFFARGQLADGTWTDDEPYVQAWTRVE